jgi:hypothetical protein
MFEITKKEDGVYRLVYGEDIDITLNFNTKQNIDNTNGVISALNISEEHLNTVKENLENSVK